MKSPKPKVQCPKFNVNVKVGLRHKLPKLTSKIPAPDWIEAYSKGFSRPFHRHWTLDFGLWNRQSKTVVTVNITGFLTDFTNGVSGIQLNSSPATVREALNELWQLHVGLRDRVVTEQGQLRQHVNIFLDGENVRRKQLLETAVPENGEITILPSVSGGNR